MPLVLATQDRVVTNLIDRLASGTLGLLRDSGGSGVADIQVEMGIGPPTGAAFPSGELRDQAGQAIDLMADRAGRAALVVFHRSAAW